MTTQSPWLLGQMVDLALILSKAATLSMTQGVRAELAAQGTLVVAVMPGTIDTPMADQWPNPKVAPA
ncbi:MAG: SDR family NAD(P)-dependent oxidoreductase, partial [Pseudanabaenales cyanobacterium]|nr:SDR family NAD(P)-dependent oxidoreductase [Pseudanabaenales cyanobacterium]